MRLIKNGRAWYNKLKQWRITTRSITVNYSQTSSKNERIKTRTFWRFGLLNYEISLRRVAALNLCRLDSGSYWRCDLGALMCIFQQVLTFHRLAAARWFRRRIMGSSESCFRMLRCSQHPESAELIQDVNSETDFIESFILNTTTWKIHNITENPCQCFITQVLIQVLTGVKHSVPRPLLHSNPVDLYISGQVVLTQTELPFWCNNPVLQQVIENDEITEIHCCIFYYFLPVNICSQSARPARPTSTNCCWVIAHNCMTHKYS